MPLSQNELMEEVTLQLIELQGYSDEIPAEILHNSPKMKATGNWIASAYNALAVGTRFNPTLHRKVEAVFSPIINRRKAFGEEVRTTREEIRQIDKLIEEFLKGPKKEELN